MTTRYFAATDGKLTYFRASPSRVYRSMTLYPDRSYNPYTFHMHANGSFPVHEITGKEYRALIRLKAQRDPRATAPSDSWVFNSQLPGEPEPAYADPQPNDGPARLAMLFPGLGSRRIVCK